MSAIVFGLLAAAALGALILAAINFTVIVPPNRAAVITGRRRTLSDGRLVGYRIVRGRRTLRIPIIESIEYLSLEPRAIELAVSRALSKGAIPLNLQLVATVRISAATDADLESSVELLLGKRPDEIEWIAYEALTSNVRAALAGLAPEQVNEDRLELGARLSDQASLDLRKLGLVLEMLKIQDVTDEVGYFEAIAQRRTATAREEAQLAEAESGMRVAEAEHRLRILEAQLRGEAATARLAASQAEAQAEQELQQRRVAAERERLKADVIAPAQADRSAADDRAWAAAAPLIAIGRAKARVLQQLLSALREDGGVAARDLTPELLAQLIAYATAELPYLPAAPVTDAPLEIGPAPAENGRSDATIETAEPAADEQEEVPEDEEDPWKAVVPRGVRVGP